MILSQSNGDVDMISKDTLFASPEPADLLPDVILPQANLSSYITTEHGRTRDFSKVVCCVPT